MALDRRCRDRIAFGAVSAICLGFGTWLLSGAWRLFRLSGVTVSSHCTVLESSYDRQRWSDSDDPHPWQVDVRFVHEVDGRRYEREDQPGEYASANEAERVTARYRKGAEVPCLYRRGDPSVVGLLQRDPGAWIAPGAMGAGIFAIPPFVLVFGSRVRKRR